MKRLLVAQEPLLLYVLPKLGQRSVGVLLVVGCKPSVVVAVEGILYPLPPSLELLNVEREMPVYVVAVKVAAS